MTRLTYFLHIHLQFHFSLQPRRAIAKKEDKEPLVSSPRSSWSSLCHFPALCTPADRQSNCLQKKTDCCKSAHLKVPINQGPQFKLAQVYRWFSGSAGWLCVHKRQARALREMAGIPRPCRYLPRSLPRCLGAHLCIVVY